MSYPTESSADKTASLLRTMFPDTSAPPTPLARARIALDLAIEERNSMPRVHANLLPAVRERIAKLRTEVKKLSSGDHESGEAS